MASQVAQRNVRMVQVAVLPASHSHHHRRVSIQCPHKETPYTLGTNLCRGVLWQGIRNRAPESD